jgi:putative hydrolase of the HAD superfamily
VKSGVGARPERMTPTPRVRAVLFDLGGTLVDYHDFAHWSDLAKHVFVEATEEDLAHAFVEVENETDGPDTRTSHTEFWRRTLSRASGKDVPNAAAVRFIALIRERPGFYRLYSDSRRCLEDLRDDDRRLAVVSNSTSEAHIRGILHSTGILPFFEKVISSGTEGVEKPDPEIFHRTLERMQLRPDEAFYVGNLAYTDAEAARKAGLHSVWLHRDGTGMSDDPPEITSLLELPLCIAQLDRRSPAESPSPRRAT